MELSSYFQHFTSRKASSKSGCDDNNNVATAAAPSPRKRHHSSSSVSSSSLFPKGYLAVVVIVVIITLQFSTPVRSATINKRSAEQLEESCRINAICGWEVYHPSTRNLQYYVASSCKCSPKEICHRAEDDVSISAYVFRCRDHRRRKTTRRPSTELNETS